MRHEWLSKLITGLILGGVFFSQPVYSQPIAADKNNQEQPVKQTQKTKKGSDSTFRLGEVEVKLPKPENCQRKTYLRLLTWLAKASSKTKTSTMCGNCLIVFQARY